MWQEHYMPSQLTHDNRGKLLTSLLASCPYVISPTDSFTPGLPLPLPLGFAMAPACGGIPLLLCLGERHVRRNTIPTDEGHRYL